MISSMLLRKIGDSFRQRPEEVKKQTDRTELLPVLWWSQDAAQRKRHITDKECEKSPKIILYNEKERGTPQEQHESSSVWMQGSFQAQNQLPWSGWKPRSFVFLMKFFCHHLELFNLHFKGLPRDSLPRAAVRNFTKYSFPVTFPRLVPAAPYNPFSYRNVYFWKISGAC